MNCDGDCAEAAMGADEGRGKENEWSLDFLDSCNSDMNSLWHKNKTSCISKLLK